MSEFRPEHNPEQDKVPFHLHAGYSLVPNFFLTDFPSRKNVKAESNPTIVQTSSCGEALLPWKRRDMR